MKKIKSILSFLVIISYFTINPSMNVCAEESVNMLDEEYVSNVDEVCELINSDIEYGEVVVNRSVIIGGQINYLYCEFEDESAALDKFKIKYANELKDIEDYFKIDELSTTNWELYRNYYEKYKSDICISDKDGNQLLPNESLYMRMDQFFDIYENKSKNNMILNLANSDALLENEGVDLELILSLPDYSPSLEEYTEVTMESRELFASQSLLSLSDSDGAAYAATWATNRNLYEYASFSTDCTNFASQILEASGVSQDVYSSEYLGWWHKSTGMWVGGQYVLTHTHSISWIRADTFAKYMGVGYTTKSHYAFSANIRQYDFIGFDEYSDGDWNHIGYVTLRDSSFGPYGYYDYKVAQHTTDYHAWASTSTNNWDTLEASSHNYTYARIRR